MDLRPTCVFLSFQSSVSIPDDFRASRSRAGSGGPGGAATGAAADFITYLAEAKLASQAALADMPAGGEWGVILSDEAYRSFVAAVVELKRKRNVRRRELYRLKKQGVWAPPSA